MIDCHTHVGVELLAYLRGEFPYSQQLINLIEDGRPYGVERFVVFPMVSNLTHSIKGMCEGEIVAENGIESVPYQFENRRLMQEVFELFPEEGKHAIPFAMLDPMRETQAQAEALRALHADYPFRGLKMQGTILRSPVIRLLDEGRLFLELAEEWNLPFLIHSSVMPDDIWSQTHDILDIVEKTPAVRFCLAHSCRFDRAALDRVADLPNAWFDCSALGIHCDLAVEGTKDVAPPEGRFESDYSNPAHVLRELADAYPSALLWGSDAPYYSFVATHAGHRYALRSTYAKEAQYLNALPADLRRRVARDNTLQFLGLPE